MVGLVERLSIYAGITFMVQFHCMTEVRLKRCTIQCGIKEMAMDKKEKLGYTFAVIDLVETCMGMIAKYPDRSIEVIEHMTKRLDQLEGEYILVEYK